MRRPRTTTRRAWENPADQSNTIQLGNATLQRCNAALRNSNPPRRCKRPVMLGKQVCKLHGGASPGAPIVHGRYSTKLGPLAAAYEEFSQRDDMLDVKPGLAAMDAFIAWQAAMAEAGDGKEFRQAVRTLAREVQAAYTAGDTQALAERLGALGKVAEEGAEQLNTMLRVVDAVARRQHHTEKARELEMRGEQVVTAKAVLAFLDRVVAIVRQEAPKHADRIVDRVTREVVATGSGQGGAVR